ncbi:MAG TPA: hypothetical protein VH088_21595 [Terriglobales bacterium]|nr:hypothetical protein [Terriglobales bacterium]
MLVNFAQFVLQVIVQDLSKPATDLGAILKTNIPNVQVSYTLPRSPVDVEPTLVFVAPEGEYDASELFALIEQNTEKWFDSRTDSVTVEVRKPDGHVQVLAR